MAIRFKLNGKDASFDVDPQMPLLWLLRERAGLTGTKFGCGIAACGACTVHLDGTAVRSCVLPAAAVDGKTVTTIEGLAAAGGDRVGERLHRVQQAWIELQVPQCGYCQSGMLMTAAALLAEHPQPSDEQIDAAMTNVCRCGTYVRVRKAIGEAAKQGALK